MKEKQDERKQRILTTLILLSENFLSHLFQRPHLPPPSQASMHPSTSTVWAPKTSQTQSWAETTERITHGLCPQGTTGLLKNGHKNAESPGEEVTCSGLHYWGRLCKEWVSASTSAVSVPSPGSRGGRACASGGSNRWWGYREGKGSLWTTQALGRPV